MVLDVFPMILDTFPIILYILSVVADSILSYPSASFTAQKNRSPYRPRFSLFFESISLLS